MFHMVTNGDIYFQISFNNLNIFFHINNMEDNKDIKEKQSEAYSEGLLHGLLIGSITIAFLMFLLLLHYKSMIN
jgi:hypothetical protein